VLIDEVSETKDVIERFYSRIASLEKILEYSSDLTDTQRDHYEQELVTLRKGRENSCLEQLL
jgi:primosomal protein N'